MAADLDVERPGGNCTRVTRRYDYNRMTPSKGIVVGIDGPALFIDQDRWAETVGKSLWHQETAQPPPYLIK